MGTLVTISKHGPATLSIACPETGGVHELKVGANLLECDVHDAQLRDLMLDLGEVAVKVRKTKDDGVPEGATLVRTSPVLPPQDGPVNAWARQRRLAQPVGSGAGSPTPENFTNKEE